MRRQIFGKSSHTINMQIQRLMQDPDAERRWTLTDLGRDITATRVVADSMEYGWPYIRRYNNLNDIITGLEGAIRGKRTIMSHSLTIAYCLEGQLDDAVREFASDVDFMREHPTFRGLTMCSA